MQKKNLFIMKNLFLLALISFFALTSCENSDFQEEFNQNSNVLAKGSQFLTDIPENDTGGNGSGSSCNDTFSFGGNCNSQGFFSGSLILEDCKKVTISADYNYHTLTNLNVTLPSRTNTVKYSILSNSLLEVGQNNPPTPSWFYDNSNNVFKVSLVIKKTTTVYNTENPWDNGNTTNIITYLYKTIVVNTCDSVMSI